MAKRFLNEDVLTAETLQKNADIDRQIAAIQENIIKKQQEIANLSSQIQKLTIQKSNNVAADAARNKNSQQPVNTQQTKPAETKPTEQPVNANANESADTDFMYPKETSFIFDDDSEYKMNDDIDSYSLLEDDDEEEEKEEESDFFYIFVDDEYNDDKFIGKIYKKFNNSKWRESIIEGYSDKFGTNSYMEDLSKDEILEWLNSDYSKIQVIDENQLDEYIEEYFR